MRKTLICVLCALLALSATACGAGAAPAATPVPEPMTPVESAEPAEAASPDETESLPAEADDASQSDAEEAPASATDAVMDAAAMAAAEACVGQPVEALYNAVGEPDGGAQYAASCLEENAEDGMLFYDELSFYVWTVKDETEEIVHAVYPLEG